MGNSLAFDRLERLRAMAKSRPGTPGFSRKDLEAIQMAVDVLELLVDTDRRHNGDLEMYDVDVLDAYGNVDSGIEPKMLCVGGSDEHYGETCFECFVKGAEALRQLKSTSA